MLLYVLKWLLTLDFTWLIVAVAIVGAVANARQKRWGFALWIVSNGYLCVYDLFLGLCSQSALYLVFLLISLDGLIFWSKNPAKRVVEQNTAQDSEMVYVFVGMFQGINDEVKVFRNEKDAEAAWSAYTEADYSEFAEDESVLNYKYEGSTIYVTALNSSYKEAQHEQN